METYEVIGNSLLSELVAALVSHSREEATVVRTLRAYGRAAVRVDAIRAGRWMVVTSGGTDDALLLQALQEGATGVVDLTASADEFQRALEALDGTHPPHVSTSVLRILASLGRRPQEDAIRLTRRELEVIALVAEGNSNREIADALVISANTVRTHLHALSVKLEVESRTRMVARARALGLLSHTGAERTAERSSA